MEFADDRRLASREVGQQVLAQQRVESVPCPSLVERHDEMVGPGEQLEGSSGVVHVRDGVADRTR